MSAQPRRILFFSWIINLSPPSVFHINDKDKSTQQDYAKACATSIQQWLKSAAENPVVFPNESKAENQTLRAENIAVLVRGYTEADLVKKELQALGIASVYLRIEEMSLRVTQQKNWPWFCKPVWVWRNDQFWMPLRPHFSA